MSVMVRTKEDQIASLRQGIDDIRDGRAVGVLVLVHGDGHDNVMSIASANVDPLEAFEALIKAATIVKNSLDGDEEELH